MTLERDFAHFVFCVLPYLSVPCCVFFTFRRAWVWVKLFNPAVMLLPGPLSVFRVWGRQYRPTIPLFPARRGFWTTLYRDVKGIFFFTGLWKRDRALWLGSWPYHAALAVVALAHLRFLVKLPGGLDQRLATAAGPAAFVLIGSAAYLLVRRACVGRVRVITTRSDLAAEILFVLATATGLVCARTDGADGDGVSGWIGSLPVLAPVIPDAGRWFLAHAFFVQALLLVFPFSHLLHAGGVFASRKFLGGPDSFAGVAPIGGRGSETRATGATDEARRGRP